MKSPVARLRTMLFQHPAHEPVIQQISSPHRRVDQVVVKPSTQSLTEPLTHRRAKPALALVQQITRQDLLERALQNMLPTRSLDLQRTREPERILNQMVIEKRHTRLDTRRHRDLINPHQQQLRQSQLQFEIRHAREKIRVRPLLLDMLQVLLNYTQRRQSIQTLAHLLRQHARLERLVVNNHATPEQRLIRAQSPYQLDGRTFSTSRFERRTRKIRDRSSQRERQHLGMPPEVFVNPQVTHVVLVTTEDLIGAFANLDHDRSRIAREL